MDSIDYKAAFFYPQKDPEWIKKLLIFFASVFFLVTSPASIGYSLKASRMVAQGSDKLPEWDAFGEYWTDGLRLVVTWLVYCIPVIAIIIILTVMSGAAASTSESAGAAANAGVSLISTILNILWSAFAAAITPAIAVALVTQSSWGAGFDFSAIKKIVSTNITAYVIVAVLSYVFNMLGGLGICVCLVGIALSLPYFQLATAHLVGQLTRMVYPETAASPEYQ